MEAPFPQVLCRQYSVIAHQHANTANLGGTFSFQIPGISVLILGSLHIVKYADLTEKIPCSCGFQEESLAWPVSDIDARSITMSVSWLAAWVVSTGPRV